MIITDCSEITFFQTFYEGINGTIAIFLLQDNVGKYFIP